MKDSFNNNENTNQEQSKEMDGTMRDYKDENGNNQMSGDNQASKESMMNAGEAYHTQSATDSVPMQNQNTQSSVAPMGNDNTTTQNVQQAQNAQQPQNSTYHYSYVNNDNRTNADATNSNQREYVTYPNQNGNSSQNGYRPASYQYQNTNQQAKASGNAHADASTN